MFEYRPVSKESQTHSKRIKPTQRQMGAISPSVRSEVKARSKGLCEVRKRCNGVLGVHMAHITSRKHLNHVTTAADILHACVECHTWLDSHPDGIRFKRTVRPYTATGFA